MIISRQRGVAYLKTRHFSFAIKGPSFTQERQPHTLAIPLGFGARITIRLRAS